jgi:RNA polymerase sigma-70 factor (ECF subfamily)
LGIEYHRFVAELCPSDESLPRRRARRRLCRDPEDARDVLQDTPLAMARGVRDFRGASSLSTWLYAIARSFCIKKRHRSKHAPEEERSLEGLTAAEVAKVLGITTQAVKSRLHRARLSVRERVAPLLDIKTDLPAAPGTCPDVLTMYSQHLEDEISADLCAQMERHLKRCGQCRGACDSLTSTLAMCRTAGASTTVPANVQASFRGAIRGFLSENG